MSALPRKLTLSVYEYAPLAHIDADLAALLAGKAVKCGLKAGKLGLGAAGMLSLACVGERARPKTSPPDVQPAMLVAFAVPDIFQQIGTFPNE